MLFRAQGATEYLVLLAVVLIVALVSVALLSFFPGMATDSQIAQSQIYWSSASPISIVESAAKIRLGTSFTYIYMRVRNAGTYPIRLTKIIGADGGSGTTFAGTNCGATNPSNISDYFYLGPGEEKYFSYSSSFGTPCGWVIVATDSATTNGYIGGASSLCQNSTTAPGTLDYKSIGFEYIAYIDGQQITKRQIGKDFIVKCMPPG